MGAVKTRNRAIFVICSLWYISSVLLPFSSASSCLLQPYCVKKVMKNGVMRRLVPTGWLRDHAQHGNCFASGGSSVCYVTCDVTASEEEVAVASISKISGESSLYFAFVSAANTPLNTTYAEIPGTSNADDVFLDQINGLVYWSQLSSHSNHTSLRRSDLYGNTEILLQASTKLLFAVDVEGNCLFYTPAYATEEGYIIRSIGLVAPNSSCINPSSLDMFRMIWISLYVDNIHGFIIGVAKSGVVMIPLDGLQYMRTTTDIFSKATSVSVVDTESRVYYAVGPRIYYVTYGGLQPHQLLNYQGRRKVEFIASYGQFMYVVVNRDDAKGELYMIDIETERSISMAVSLTGMYGEQLQLGIHTKL